MWIDHEFTTPKVTEIPLVRERFSLDNFNGPYTPEEPPEVEPTGTVLPFIRKKVGEVTMGTEAKIIYLADYRERT